MSNRVCEFCGLYAGNICERRPDVECQALRVSYHWTMVGDDAIAGPFDTPSEAYRAGVGVYGAWVQSGCMSAPYPDAPRREGRDD